MSSEGFNLKKHIAGLRAGKRLLDDVVIVPAKKKLPKAACEAVSSLANASGGIIVLGLSRKRDYAPCKGLKPRRIARALRRACASKLEPPIPVHVRVKKLDGRKVVVARVPEIYPVHKPCHIKSRGIREGSYLSFGGGRGYRKLSCEEVDGAIERRRQPNYDMQLVAGSGENDLDMQLVSGFLRRGREVAPYVFDRLSDEEALETAGVLVAGDDGTRQLTLAGLMALGRHPQRYYPRAAIVVSVFPGSWKSVKDLALESVQEDMRRELRKDAHPYGEDVALYSQTIVGPIPVMVSETIDAIHDSMVRATEHTDATGFGEFGRALREVIVNALMHRSYAPADLGSQVRINIRKDRIEVVSPGGLTGEVTVRNMAQHGVSASRNPHLAQILECVPFTKDSGREGHIAENRGAGFAYVQAALRLQRCPEAFPIDGLTRFTVVLRTRGMARCEDAVSHDGKDATASRPGKKGEDHGTSAAGDELPDPAAAEEAPQPATDGEMIMALVEKTGSVSSSEVARLLGVSSATALRRLRELVAKGQLVLSGNHGRSSRYVPAQRASAAGLDK